MLEPQSPLTRLRADLTANRTTLLDVARTSAACANSNASKNAYLHFHADALLRQAAALEARFGAAHFKPALYGVPVSLKDCFDLAGTPTTCGSHFYAARPAASNHSAVAGAILQAGALITGKTHLHPLAYGITGQNPEYGDCLQPRDATLLTGGSSSGAAASVQEGSALAAIGTDTGGSIRVPAALCGLVGFRTSHTLPTTLWPRAWAGGAHLAPSFDTLGFLLRDPRDAAPIAEALFGISPPHAIAPAGLPRGLRIGVVDDSFLHDCAADVLAGFAAWKAQLAAFGAGLTPMVTEDWANTFEVFAGIQAHEAAEIHCGHFDHFEASIRDRLAWGASLDPELLDAFAARLQAFRASIQSLFDTYDLLMLPASPVSRLRADADLSDARRIILRYTTPFSLAGLPTITLPGECIGAPFGTGVQIAATPGADSMLLAFAGQVGHQVAQQASRMPAENATDATLLYNRNP